MYCRLGKSSKWNKLNNIFSVLHFGINYLHSWRQFIKWTKLHIDVSSLHFENVEYVFIWNMLIYL